MIYVTAVAAVATVLMGVFGVLWLRTLNELHAAEAKRDNDWDTRHGIQPTR